MCTEGWGMPKKYLGGNHVSQFFKATEGGNIPPVAGPMHLRIWPMSTNWDRRAWQPTAFTRSWISALSVGPNLNCPSNVDMAKMKKLIPFPKCYYDEHGITFRDNWTRIGLKQLGISLGWKAGIGKYPSKELFYSVAELPQINSTSGRTCRLSKKTVLLKLVCKHAHLKTKTWAIKSVLVPADLPILIYHEPQDCIPARKLLKKICGYEDYFSLCRLLVKGPKNISWLFKGMRKKREGAKNH